MVPAVYNKAAFQPTRLANQLVVTSPSQNVEPMTTTQMPTLAGFSLQNQRH